MAQEGTGRRRAQVLADVVALRDSVQGDVIGTQLLLGLDVVDPAAALAMTLGYLCTVLDGLCAAVIYLASPCCGECQDGRHPAAQNETVIPKTGTGADV